jgi:hypothetical protein
MATLLEPTAAASTPDITTTVVPIPDGGSSSTKESGSEETPEARVLAQGLYSPPI